MYFQSTGFLNYGLQKTANPASSGMLLDNVHERILKSLKWKVPMNVENIIINNTLLSCNHNSG